MPDERVDTRPYLAPRPNSHGRESSVEVSPVCLQGVRDLARILLSCQESSQVFDAASRSIKGLIQDTQSVLVFMPYEEEPGTLVAELAETPYAGYVRSLALNREEGLLGQAILGEQTLLVPDVGQIDLRCPLASEGSVVVAPLFLEAEQLKGALYVGAVRAETFGSAQRDLIETISYLISMKLRDSRLSGERRRMQMTDELTGLLKFRVFEGKVSEELERQNQALVLALLDVDCLRSYTDTLGLPSGDAALKGVAAVLKDEVPDRCIVSRYGGDEFALLLPDTSKDKAISLCERIRQAVQRRFAGHAVPLTISVGLAAFPEDGVEKTSLLRAADEALYTAKRGGRNRVV
jgi:diguanylate cyclase (GGDEF)-like protein